MNWNRVTGNTTALAIGLKGAYNLGLKGGFAKTTPEQMMRHADIRTILNIYGGVVTDEMEQAHRKGVGLALNGPAN